MAYCKYHPQLLRTLPLSGSMLILHNAISCWYVALFAGMVKGRAQSLGGATPAPPRLHPCRLFRQTLQQTAQLHTWPACHASALTQPDPHSQPQLACSETRQSVVCDCRMNSFDSLLECLLATMRAHALPKYEFKTQIPALLMPSEDPLY